MIVNAAESHIVGSLGWIDGPAVWCYSVATGQASSIVVGDADYLSLHAGREDTFACVHHHADRPAELSAHVISAPRERRSSIIFEGDQPLLSGDVGLWRYLPSAYVGSGSRGNPAPQLIRVFPDSRAVSVEPLAWFDDRFDAGYQSVLGVAQVPGSQLLLFSIQRDSQPVLYDPDTRTELRRIALAGRAGNAILRFRTRAPELWACDYDTIVRLETTDWLMLDSYRAQPSAPGTARFVADIAFDKAERVCVVARTFSRDLIALDTASFRVTHRAPLDGQPIGAAVLSDGRVFSREWKTGALLRGVLEPITGRI